MSVFSTFDSAPQTTVWECVSIREAFLCIKAWEVAKHNTVLLIEPSRLEI